MTGLAWLLGLAGTVGLYCTKQHAQQLDSQEVILSNCDCNQSSPQSISLLSLLESYNQSSSVIDHWGGETVRVRTAVAACVGGWMVVHDGVVSGPAEPAPSSPRQLLYISAVHG